MLVGLQIVFELSQRDYKLLESLKKLVKSIEFDKVCENLVKYILSMLFHIIIILTIPSKRSFKKQFLSCE